MKTQGAKARFLLILFVMSLLTAPALVGFGITNFDSLITSGDVVVGDDLTVTSDVGLGGELTVTPGAAETIGYDEQIDPVTTYHKITSAANRGTDNIAAGAAGDLLVLHNVGSNTITLTDTGTLLLSGNAALGPNDMIVLLSDGTNWIQLTPEGDN